MWEAGVRHVLQDHQTFSAYVPLMAGAFWQGLPPALQDLVTRTWADNIATYRARMAAAQDAARNTLFQHGLSFSDPTRRRSGRSARGCWRSRTLSCSDGAYAGDRSAGPQRSRLI